MEDDGKRYRKGGTRERGYDEGVKECDNIEIKE